MDLAMILAAAVLWAIALLTYVILFAVYALVHLTGHSNPPESPTTKAESE